MSRAGTEFREGEDEIFKALASPSRRQLLAWLKDPQSHFPPQREGDLEGDGVCALHIAEKWQVTPATASRHLKLLESTGLVTCVRKRGWCYYRRNEPVLRAFAGALAQTL
ncbi:helix-turn-helix transcriptional regulator [Erythrobacter mangrovi]|uniref:Helix-turn-helix transcriptional regulator n=1 Tax=Erythrobacter mangrovi TaxID=2739433 RepID=A0A7D4BTH2_9SPHN|nr:helix-turn-helix transcriptional regulator [Erythrobacter mangrovi]